MGDTEILPLIVKLQYAVEAAKSLGTLFLISLAAVYLRWKYLHLTAPADTMHMW